MTDGTVRLRLDMLPNGDLTGPNAGEAEFTPVRLRLVT